jgi:uncharacterized membrane protein
MAELFYEILEKLGFGHPLHAVVVHVIIGPIIAMVAFALIAWVFNKPTLWKTARQLSVLSLVMWFPAVGIGVIDWLYFYNGNMEMPTIVWKSIGSAVLLVVLVLNVLLFRRLKAESRINLVLYLLAAILVGIIGMKGGDIVFGATVSQNADPVNRIQVEPIVPT